MALTCARAGRVLGSAVALAATLAAVPGASASELVDRNARSVSLEVNAKGVALVQYAKAGGGRAHVLYWGAGGGTAVRFQHDRSGGWKSRKADWQRFRNACGPYRGPALFAAVAACTARDGSHWALQAWTRVLPIGARSGVKELRLSHWRGDVARLWVKPDWSWRGRWRHLYGQLTWHGRPVYGHHASRTGYVLDGIGRNVMLFSLDSDYGRGWRFVNGFLTNKPSGQFCYGLNRKTTGSGLTRTGVSSVGRYRMSVPGPGVTPDVMVEFGHVPGSYSRAFDAQANREQLGLLKGIRKGSCWPVN